MFDLGTYFGTGTLSFSRNKIIRKMVNAVSEMKLIMFIFEFGTLYTNSGAEKVFDFKCYPQFGIPVLGQNYTYFKIINAHVSLCVCLILAKTIYPQHIFL